MDILHLKDSEDLAVSRTIVELKKGGLVVAPSDTVYGLLVDASNESAVKKLVAFKNRPFGKSISVFVADFTMADKYVQMNDKQRAILKRLLPGPFTVILDSRHQTSKLIESEKGTLGIRIPDHDFIKELISRFGRPATATSANLGGRSPHYSVESLLHQLPQSKKEMIDLIVDAGQLPRNKPSTVVDLTTPQLKIIRQGDIVFKNEATFITKSPAQTRKIAQHIFKKYLDTDKPTVFILKGELGSGKTVYVKGIGEYLGIQNIISPTFTVSYEYDIKKPFKFKKLYHYDLYNIEEAEELKYLGFDETLQNKNIICIEWGEKAGDILDFIKTKADIVFVEIKYEDPATRTLKISSPAD